jgi:hypothetical protein
MYLKHQDISYFRVKNKYAKTIFTEKETSDYIQEYQTIILEKIQLKYFNNELTHLTDHLVCLMLSSV